LYFIDLILHASSIKSIALSGRFLSVTYLIDKSTASFTASSEIFKLWYVSKESFSEFKILIDVFFDGSLTVIFCNLLSNAESFSMYFLNSFQVVAQIILIFHLHIAGFRIFDASSVHSAHHAQIIVCNSSINNIISFSTFEASSITCFILTSNSHLYLVQATKEDISRAKIFLSFIENGTFHSLIASANHSAIAVLPTHGSQTSTGLFFVFLFNIAISLSISSSLQKILSIFHSSASFDKLVEKKSNAGVVESFFLACLVFQSNGVCHVVFQNKP